MTDLLTSTFIVAAAIVIVAFDIWAVWKRGGNATVSWVLDTWTTSRPIVMAIIFGVIGHIFFPECAPANVADSQSIGPVLGTCIGGAAIIALVAWLIYALLSMAVGHFAFAQYIECQ